MASSSKKTDSATQATPTGVAPPTIPPISAVFLDRDGVIIEDVHFLSKPSQVRLIPGAAQAIARLNQSNIPVIVVTNQSGIARGFLTEQGHKKITQHLDKLLAQHGAKLTDSYYCPHHPDFTELCSCRKPADGMFRKAFLIHRIAPTRAVFIGDRWRDIAPSRKFGATAILVPSTQTTREDKDLSAKFAMSFPTLAKAVDALLTGKNIKKPLTQTRPRR